MLSPYRFDVALIICGILTAYFGLAMTVIALFTTNQTAHSLARNLMFFSFLCLALHASLNC